MTEEEARLKLCHRKFDKDKSYQDVNCDASECAAWRWTKIPNPDYKPSSMNVFPQPWPMPPMFIESDTDGYCGLAGQP